MCAIGKKPSALLIVALGCLGWQAVPGTSCTCHASLSSCTDLVQVVTEPGFLMLDQTPEQYAERMWRSCTGSPFAPADKLLLPEDMESLRPRFWDMAVRHAEACTSADGSIADPFVEMYVVATLAA